MNSTIVTKNMFTRVSPGNRCDNPTFKNGSYGENVEKTKKNKTTPSNNIHIDIIKRQNESSSTVTDSYTDAFYGPSTDEESYYDYNTNTEGVSSNEETLYLKNRMNTTRGRSKTEMNALEEYALQRRHNREMRQLRRMFKTRHLLKRSTRFRLWCAKLWSCERLAFAIIIITCGLVTMLSSLFFVGYIEYEWRHTLEHGVCKSRNCSEVVSHHKYGTITSASADLESIVCVCDMYFNPSVGVTPSAHSTNISTTTFRESFVGHCPRLAALPFRPYNDDGTIDVYDQPSNVRPVEVEQFRRVCWRNPASEIWFKYPNLWIIKIMVVIFTTTLIMIILCFMFVSTGHANVNSHIEDDIVQSVLKVEENMNNHPTPKK